MSQEPNPAYVQGERCRRGRTCTMLPTPGAWRLNGRTRAAQPAVDYQWLPRPRAG